MQEKRFTARKPREEVTADVAPAAGHIEEAFLWALSWHGEQQAAGCIASLCRTLAGPDLCRQLQLQQHALQHVALVSIPSGLSKSSLPYMACNAVCEPLHA